jgi:hypothetical protein
LKNSQGSLLSLAPKSKAPIHKRRSKVSPRIRDFILNYRYEHILPPCGTGQVEDENLEMESGREIGNSSLRDKSRKKRI